MKPVRRKPFPAPARTTIAEAGISSRRDVVVLLIHTAIVAAVVVAVYRPVLRAQAISFDDEETIIENPLVQNPSLDSVERFFSEVRLSSVVPGYYRPLTLTSLMLDWAMGARVDNFRPFHRTSLALHVCSTVLLVILCYQLFGRPMIAAAVGLLFGLHPLTIEPVAWVMERKTVLAAVFAFACLCAYVRYAHCGRWRWFAFALLLYLLSLLSKPTGTPLPIMLLLLDYWPLRRLDRRAPASAMPRATPWLSQAVIEKLPFVALAAAFALLAIVCEERVNPLYIPAKLSPLHLPLRLCWLIIFYLSKVVLPIGLSSAYQPPRPLSVANPIVLWAVVGTALLIVSLIFSRRWTPAIWVGAAIFSLGLAPTMGFVGYSWVVASDKYVYLPAVGLVVMLAYLLGRLAFDHTGRLRPLAASIAAACVLAAASAEAVRIHIELPYWENTEKLCLHMLEATPNAAALHTNIAMPLVKQGRNDEALEHLTRALRLEPRSHIVQTNYGSALAARGQIDEAISHYLIALRIRPHHKQAMNNLAWDLAVHDFDRPVTNADPIALAREVCQLTDYRSPTFLDTLAAAYANAGRFPEAIDTAGRAICRAEATGDRRLARDIRERLRLYLAGRAYREVAQRRPTSIPEPDAARKSTNMTEDQSR